MTLLVEATLKSSAVLLVALAAVALLRRQSAAARHWLLATAIVSAAVLPLVASVAPRWWVMPAVMSATPGRPAAPAVDVSFELPSDVIGSKRADIMRFDSDRATMCFAVVWLLGCGASLAALAAGLGRLRALARDAVPVDDEVWLRSMQRTAAEIGLTRPVRLLEGPGSQLVTWGVLRPVLFVPRDARGWDEDRIAIVLRHELAHVLRCDWAIHLVVAVARAVWWFDPIMWIASFRLRHESEHACDDVVLRSGVTGAAYASHLVDLARDARGCGPWVPAQAIVRPSQLERRVRAMLQSNVNRRPVTRRGRVVPIAAMLLTTVVVAGFGRAAQSGTVLSGTVTDTMGRGMPGASVTLISVDSKATHEVTTDQAGRFAFVPLPPGAYKLLAKKAGFQVTAESVSLSGAAVTRPVTMAIGTVEESIRVTDPPVPAKPSSMTAEQRREKARESRASDPCAASAEGGCLLPPIKLVDVKPIFPESSKGTAIAEPVVLRAVIATDGTVRDVTVVSSPNPELTNAAMDAVRQWEFAPTQLDGVPIETAMRVTVRFER